jgi:hypothetical protein
MTARMWSLNQFRFDQAEAAEVLGFEDETEPKHREPMLRDDAIALAHSRGVNLVESWPQGAGEAASCVMIKVTLPLRWEVLPEEEEPVDERLWFQATCGGRDYLVGSGNTFTGRMAAWCPAQRVGYNVSLGEIGTMPDETRYFITGFLAGAQPDRPVDDQGDMDEADLAAWRSATQRFRRTGYWYGRWGTCKVCGCVLLPDTSADHCAEHSPQASD